MVQKDSSLWRRILTNLTRFYGNTDKLHQKSPTVVGETVMDSLIGTLLSQSTTDLNAVRAFHNLKKRFNNWEAVLSAKEEELLTEIRISGLGRQKARYIKEILIRVKEIDPTFTLSFLQDYTPSEARAYLLSLPGVGEKTAACVQAFALDQPSFPVDTHLWRVIRRINPKWKEFKTRTSLQKELELSIPEDVQGNLHIYLLNIGREFCRPRFLKCAKCPLAAACYTASGINDEKK